MAKARKDNKGRALRKGESQRTDNTYVYTYTDPFKKRRFVYAKDLQTLRQKEEDLIKLKEFLDRLNIEKIDILPYHTLGKSKWEKLGIQYELDGTRPANSEDVAKAKKILGI